MRRRLGAGELIGHAKLFGRARLLGLGAIGGASFALAAGTIEVLLWTIGKLRLGVAAPREAMAGAVLFGIALGAVLGLLAAPLLRVRRGPLLHLLAVLAAWAVLGLAAGLPDLMLYRALTIAPWLAGFALVLLGRRISRRDAWVGLPAAMALAVLAATLVAPPMQAWFRAPRNAKPAAAPTGAPGAPDVVVVVLDTLRADHVGSYGYHRPTTPHLDALAAEGALFLDATAPGTWSLPSHASLFTGLFPASHGAHAEHRFLEPGAPTLAERLADAGYDTRCFTANAWITDEVGLARGFRWSNEAWQADAMGRTRLFAFRLLDRLGFGTRDKGGDMVVRDFEQWAADTPRGRTPTFAFVNLIESHFPYHQVPEEFLARFADGDRAALRELSLALMEAQFGGEPPDPARAVGPATDMYDAGVAYADHLLGRMVEALRRRGTLDRTVLIVLSDHGELLGEHGAWGHGHSLYEVETRVPLVIRLPGRVPAGALTTTPVSTVGVYATVMDLLGLDAPSHLQVRSLLPVLDGGPAVGPVIAERFADQVVTEHSASAERGAPLLRSDLRFRSFRSAQGKLVVASDGSSHLFDLGDDPRELHDRAAERPADVAQLRARLDAWRRQLDLAPLDSRSPAPRQPDRPDLDPTTRQRLRALGYIE